MSTVRQLKPRTTQLLDGEYGDGDDGDNTPMDSVTVKSISNGWMITTTFDDGDDVVEAFDTDGKDDGDLQTVKCILESMGLENKIKVSLK